MTTPFEKDYGPDPKLAERILNDPFKAPEQKLEAWEYLNSVQAGRKNNSAYNESTRKRSNGMDEKIKVTETDIEVSMVDQVLTTILGAIAGLVASKLVESGYYSAKARFLVKRTAAKN